MSNEPNDVPENLGKLSHLYLNTYRILIVLFENLMRMWVDRLGRRKSVFNVTFLIRLYVL